MKLQPEPPADATSWDVFTNREFRFTARDFRHIAAMVHKDAGIELTEIKAPLVYSRLAKRIRVLNLPTFRDYCALVESEDGAAERGHMLAALTTNVTRFFREPHHFEHLKAKVLPALVDGIRRGAPLRIWSAGCSTGEEPYSIALTILSVMPDAAKFDVKILATDINHNVLELGRQGRFGEAAIAHISRQQRAEWFVSSRAETGEKVWSVGDELRSFVAFRELNLMDDWPMRQRYQAVFCRNVAIYLEERARDQIWDRLAGQLAPRGCLYVGHSERINNTDARFKLEGYTTYRLNEGAAA